MEQHGNTQYEENSFKPVETRLPLNGTRTKRHPIVLLVTSNIETYTIKKTVYDEYFFHLNFGKS